MIAVVGLGYVGLPLAVAFAKKLGNVVGYDNNPEYIKTLTQKGSPDLGVSFESFKDSGLKATSDKEDIRGADYYIVAVPTPIDQAHRPDLSAVLSASKSVGSVMKRGSVVCFESTVYPGVTENSCAPILELESGMKCGEEFYLGYSPERINPGDPNNTLESIIKVVAGQTPEVTDRLAELYGAIIEAGVYKVSSIQVAEATKVVENTQRDLNIALMNEISIICDLFGISTREVLEATRSKWNALHFVPGLVGGHCIGVDPYYLTYCAEGLGYIPEVILAGRKINDRMSEFVANKVVKLFCVNGLNPTGAKVGVLGLTFKEDVADLRNSKVADVIYNLRDFNMQVLVHDAVASEKEALDFYGIALNPIEEFKELDALILAVPHKQYIIDMGLDKLCGMIKPSGGVFIDIKSKFRKTDFNDPMIYWAL